MAKTKTARVPSQRTGSPAATAPQRERVLVLSGTGKKSLTWREKG